MTGPVLCAVDVSNPSDDSNVLVKAAQLAKLEGTSLDVITVVPDFGMTVVGSFFDEGHHAKMVDGARQELNSLVTLALGAEQNENVRHVVATGKAYDEVLKAAKAINASLIVVGAHKTDLKDFLLGPNAARIVRHAVSSVYVVR